MRIVFLAGRFLWWEMGWWRGTVQDDPVSIPIIGVTILGVQIRVLAIEFDRR